MLLHLLFKDAPRVLNRVQVWRHTWPLHYLHFQLLQEGSGHLGGVLGVVIMMILDCMSSVNSFPAFYDQVLKEAFIWKDDHEDQVVALCGILF